MRSPIPRDPLAARTLVLGVSGGIAAYKSAELCRRLIGAGADVHCVLSEAATRFVGPATFEALSGNPVGGSLFEAAEPGTIEHIRLAEMAELILLAPATADLIARMACGRADDLLTTVLLATRAPVLVAPGMNVNMWNHPATQANVSTLRARGVQFVGPDVGDLACRTYGAGRMAEPEQLLEAAVGMLASHDLDGQRVLVTAGATRESLDPIRYITNHSSGKMGFALARAAAARGAEVTLVSGSPLTTPLRVDRVVVQSAEEMATAVLERFGALDAVIMAAAVSDWRPRDSASQKLKKTDAGQTQTLALQRTPDILALLGKRRTGDRPVLVGFAAETGDPEAEARRKLETKGCDLVVANDVSQPDAGFGVDTNRVVLVKRDRNTVPLPLASKDAVAHRILDSVAELLSRETRPS
jgi:phosphopantothenoylcysteine decarboxylase/phosphopantothenate--cysteine ligase